MVRVSVALVIGVVAAVLTGTLRHEWHYSPAVGWIVAAAVYLVWTWWVVLSSLYALGTRTSSNSLFFGHTDARLMCSL